MRAGAPVGGCLLVQPLGRGQFWTPGGRLRGSCPHLQSVLQVCLEPLPIVRHRPARARRGSSGETLGYSPIQVGAPAAGLGHLQEETVGSARLVWGTGVSSAPRPSPSETGREPGPPPLPSNSVPHGAPGGPRHTESYAGRLGYGAAVPPRPPPGAPARGRGVQRCWPDAGSPSGRGTPGRALGAGQGLGVRVRRCPLGSLTARASTRGPRRPALTAGLLGRHFHVLL